MLVINLDEGDIFTCILNSAYLLQLNLNEFIPESVRCNCISCKLIAYFAILLVIELRLFTHIKELSLPCSALKVIKSREIF